MCDQQEKGHKHEKTPKSQQVMQPHYNQGHRHQHYRHHAEDDKHNNLHSAEDIRDRQPNHPNQQDYDKTHHHHPHHCHHRQNYCHVSESTNTSSLSSSSSASSSSSTSSLSTSSFSSSLLSSSSMISSSSSSLSSEDSSEYSDRSHPRRPRHSQSFTDISGKHSKYFEEDDDTAPLINAKGYLNRHSARQRRDAGKFFLNSPTKEGGKKKHSCTSQLGNDGSFRKAKSMDDLTTPKDKAGDGIENGNEHERSKSEARENVLREKMKFSAFLNEITRQVLSPMRLSSLGVTDTQRSHSPGQVFGKSGEKDSSLDKPKQWRSQPASPDSMSSSKHSHTSKQSNSSLLPRSKSFHHRGHRSASPASHMKHRSRSCHSCSPSPEHPSHLPPHKLGHYCHQKECNNLSQCHQHRNHHHQGHHHNPAYKRRNHHSPVFYSTSHLHKDKQHKDHYSPTRHDDQHHGASHCHDHHDHSHEYHHNEHPHNLRDNYDSSRHHQDHLIIPHHHDDHHNNHSTSCPTTPCHFEHRNPTSNNGTHRGLAHQHHHGDRHRDTHQHHPDDHNLHHENHHSLGHHQHHNEAHEHHYDDHHKEANRHNHRDYHSLSYWHPSQHHHNKPQQHLENHHSPGHPHVHGDHHSKHHHTYKDQHNVTYHHRQGDHYSKSHPHGDQHSGAQHHHRDLHSPAHHPHHGNHHNETHHHDHGDHHSLVHHYHNKTYHHHQGDQPSEVHHHHQGDQQNEVHHYENHYNQGHDYCHGDYSNTSHCKGCHLESQSHLKPDKPTNRDDNRLDADPLHLLEHFAGNPPSHRKPESLVSKNSTSNTNSLSHQDKEQTSFTGPSSHEEKTHDLGRIMILQDQNEGLHQGLLKTAVQVECLGEEFISSQKLLEGDLQRTRMELNSFMEKFKRLQDDCSSTQQTNNLLEQKLHSMLQNMEGERERLNQHISELTEQLTDAKIATAMEAINTTPVFHKASLHSSDDALIQMVPPITPPPAQFMDSHNYGQDKSSVQEQPLGSVPEEEESDWSEVGEETPQLVLTGSSRGQAWRCHEVDADKDCESGSEEIVRRHFPRPLQIPHLQFTIHNEFLPPTHTTSCPSGFKNLSDSITGDIEEIYLTTTSPSVKSAILIRSASLEEIPLTRHHMQKELRGTEAMMNLHHSADEAMEDFDNEIIHHWSSDRDTVIRRMTKSVGAEADGGMASLHSAEQMLNHFIRDPPAREGADLGRAQVHGWAGGIPGKVLNVERTQL